MIAYYIEDNIACMRVGVCACELIISRTWWLDALINLTLVTRICTQVVSLPDPCTRGPPIQLIAMLEMRPPGKDVRASWALFGMMASLNWVHLFYKYWGAFEYFWAGEYHDQICYPIYKDKLMSTFGRRGAIVQVRGSDDWATGHIWI